MTTPARSVLLFLALAGALTGCEKAPSAGSGKAPAVATSGVPLPPQLFLASAPADVREIKAAKQGAKVGDTITLRGRIGGSGCLMLIDEPEASVAQVMKSIATFAAAACSSRTILRPCAAIQPSGTTRRTLRAGQRGSANIRPCWPVFRKPMGMR